MLAENIQLLFNRFQEGFTHFDLEKVIDCYHLPCTLNTPDKISVINTGAELESEVSGIFTQLTNECFASVKLGNSSFMKLTDDIAYATIDWKFLDNKNQVFSEFSAFYHLIYTKDKKLKIINATSHQINNSQRLEKLFSLNNDAV